MGEIHLLRGGNSNNNGNSNSNGFPGRYALWVHGSDPGRYALWVHGSDPGRHALWVHGSDFVVKRPFWSYSTACYRQGTRCCYDVV
jgi:hypothetical protein